MKKLVYLFVFLFIGLQLKAQQFEGIVTYKTSSNINTVMDSTKVNTEEQKKLNTMIRKSMQKEYELHFNRTESSYQKVETLKTNTGGIEVIGLASDADGGLYKNIKTKQLIELRDVFGKSFLVKDSLKHYNWELLDESRQIGNYTCYKAQFSKKQKFKANGVPDIKITAWYTTQIPVSTGPESYWGLPGLIMEINGDMTNIICTKIILNPEEKIKIKQPTKGKEVTNAEYTKIYMDKMKEIKEMYANKRKKKKG
jgi:GLPGLI family protein